jgi:cell division protease FtsH
LPFEDRKMQSKNEFLDDIAVSLAGYVAEMMIYGDVTTGPSNDLQVSSALARDMVTKYGMSEKIGPIALEGGGRTITGKGVFEERDYSEKVGSVIDAEVANIIDTNMKRAEEILKKHKIVLKAIADKLVEVENLEREEFEKLLIANGIVPKKKEE